MNFYQFVNSRPTVARDPLGLKIASDTDIAYIFDRYGINVTVYSGPSGRPPYVYTFGWTYVSHTNPWHRLQQQILKQMLRSPTTFSIAGNTIEEEHAALKQHVKTRQQVIKNVIRKRFRFPTDEDCTEFFHHTVSPNPDKYRDPQGYFDSINNANTRCACLTGTRLPFYGAIGSYNDADTRMHDNIWIPGDWGYIDNAANPDNEEPDEDGWPAGLEGENLIYIGQRWNREHIFWGHFAPGNTVLPGYQWIRDIGMWQSSHGHRANPVVDPDVHYPTIGLD